MFSRASVRTFSTSDRSASRSVRLVVDGTVRFWVAYPSRLTPHLYTAEAPMLCSITREDRRLGLVAWSTYGRVARGENLRHGPPGG